MFGLFRRRLLAGLVVILTTLGILALALAYLIPAPPSRVTMANGFQGRFLRLLRSASGGIEAGVEV